MRCIYSAIGLLLISALGCSDGMPTLVPVSGKVTLDGKPLVGKTLRFVPEIGTPGQGAGASTDKDGNYTLLAVRPGATRDMQGVPAGKYRVTVNEPMFPIDMKMPDTNGPEPTPAIGPVTAKTKQTIPAAYLNPDTTPLSVEVPANGGPIHLVLKSNATK